MAIAYFIPDQTKLLAGGSNAQTHQPTSSSATASNSSPPSPNGGSGSGTNQYQQQQQTQNQNFRANITIPLAAYVSAAPENVGCWDLITQVFCYALRFCHETRLSPAVIEISFEFNGALQQQTTTSTSGTSAVDAGTATVQTTITAASTAPNDNAVGSPTTASSDVPATTVATVRVESRTQGSVRPSSTQVGTHQVGGRNSQRAHKNPGRRSGAPRRN